jgi:hypothetical protein
MLFSGTVWLAGSCSLVRSCSRQPFSCGICRVRFCSPGSSSFGDPALFYGPVGTSFSTHTVCLVRSCSPLPSGWYVFFSPDGLLGTILFSLTVRLIRLLLPQRSAWYDPVLLYRPVGTILFYLMTLLVRSLFPYRLVVAILFLLTVWLVRLLLPQRSAWYDPILLYRPVGTILFYLVTLLVRSLLPYRPVVALLFSLTVRWVHLLPHGLVGTTWFSRSDCLRRACSASRLDYDGRVLWLFSLLLSGFGDHIRLVLMTCTRVLARYDTVDFGY